MPAASTGSSCEPFARAAALYSQHLARPPSAYHPSSGSGRQAQRRPRSASAATAPTRRQLPAPTPSPSASASPRGNTRTVHETASPKTAVRPASAAAVDKTRRTASRPSRPRPFTATGAMSTPRSNALSHRRDNADHDREKSLVQQRQNHRGRQRRRIVVKGADNGHAVSLWDPGITRVKSTVDVAVTRNKRGWRGVGGATSEQVVEGPAWGYDTHDDDGAESGGPSEGLVTRDPVVGAETTTGAEFWHEHKSIGVDRKIMERAEEFVARIIHARERGEQQNTQKQNDPSTSPPQANRHIPADLSGYGAAKPEGSAQNVKARRVGGGVRCKGRGNVAGVATFIGRRSTRLSIPNSAKPDVRAEAGVLNPSRLKDSHRPGATSIVPVHSSELSLPSGETGRGLGNVVAEDDSCLAHDQPSPAVKEVAEGDDEGNKGDSTRLEPCSSLVVTPLHFDVFCSLRPTLSSQVCTKRERPKTATASRGAGLSLNAPGNTQGNGNRSSHAACRSHCEADEEQLLYGGPSIGDSGGLRPSCAWTSVFGAVCAGAERGRARAEVLEAARRESLRQSRRRRRAADVSAAVSRSNLVRVDSVPSPVTSVGPADAIGTHLGSALDAADQYSSTEGTARKTDVGGSGSEKRVTHADGPCEVVLEDAEGQATETLAVREPRTSRAQSKQEFEMGDDGQAFDSINISSTPYDVGLEVNGPIPSDTLSQSAPGGTTAGPAAGPPIQHSPGTAATTPLFRHPFGGGTTRIGVNAPRSLQVCPGERGFSSVTASKTSRHCFSFPRGRHAHGQQSSTRELRGQIARRPSTAGGDVCPSIVATCSMGAGAGDGVQSSSLDVKVVGSGPRPKTAGSFFSTCASRRGKRVGAAWTNYTGKSDRGSLGPRWTDGESLIRRVDSILHSALRKPPSGESARSHASGTRCEREQQQQEQRELVEDRRGVDNAANIGAHETETSGANQRATVETGLDMVDDIAQEPDLAARSTSGVSGVHFSSGVAGSRNDAVFEPLVEPGVNGTATSSIMEGCREELRGEVETDDAPGGPTAPTVSDVHDTPGASNGIVSSSVDGGALSACPGRPRLIPRPSSAPSRCPTDGWHPRSLPPCPILSVDVCAIVLAQRSESSPGLIQRAHHIVSGVTAAEADSEGARQSPCRPVSHTGPGETTSDMVGGGGGERSDGDTRSSTASCLAAEGTALPYEGRDTCDALVHHPGEGGAMEQEPGEGGEGGGGGQVTGGGEEAGQIEIGREAGHERGAEAESRERGAAEGTGGNGDKRDEQGGDRVKVSTKSTHDTRLKSTHKGHACVSVALPEGYVMPLSRDPPTAGAAGLAGVVIERDGSNVKTRLEKSSAAESSEVETTLDFAKATVKLKLMAAEAGVAVDVHEKAWGVSKEKAEILFNDVRFAPEEDARRSCYGAASETRHRLQRIMIESGIETSRRVKKEADLEEIRRVLRQDTSMYAARISASDRMRETKRNLEAENDSCDFLQLKEWRRGRTLAMLRERTERDRDDLRAACRRRREEAGAMAVTLAEARHAHGRLVGHVQSVVERLACLAEYVSIMRRWCQEHLESRRHARVTSKTINTEFGRKSEELDALLKKGKVKRAPGKGEARHGRKSHYLNTAGATLTRHQDHNDNHPITTACTTAPITRTNVTDLVKSTTSDNDDDPNTANANTNTDATPNSTPTPTPCLRHTIDNHVSLSNDGDASPSIAALLDASSMLRGLLDVLAREYRPQFRSPLHLLPEN